MKQKQRIPSLDEFINESDIKSKEYSYLETVIKQIGGEIDERRSFLQRNDAEIWFKFKGYTYGVGSSFDKFLDFRNEETNKSVQIPVDFKQEDILNAIKKTQ